jgi:chitinase
MQCPANVAVWSPSSAYSIGDMVMFQGSVYRCTLPHHSQSDWTPLAAPALWQAVQCTGTCGPSGGGNNPGSGNPGSGNPGSGNPGSGNPGSGNPGSGGALPKHVLTGYWQNFNNGATVLKLKDVPSSYDLIAVAFADTDPNLAGGITFGIDSGLSAALGGYSDSDFTSDVQALHAQGRKVILSVGGQNGTINISDPTSASNFAQSASTLMQKFGFDGIDIDLENGINPTSMASALQQLASKVGPGMILTMAPQTIDMQSTGMAYFQLALQVKNILTIVNMQFYNSGSMLGCDGKVYSESNEDFLTALACIELQSQLRPDQVGIGLPSTTSAAGGGFVSPTVVNAALDCLASGANCAGFKPTSLSPSIRGAMTWSINWDAQNGYNFANTIAPHLKTLP